MQQCSLLRPQHSVGRSLRGSRVFYKSGVQLKEALFITGTSGLADTDLESHKPPMPLDDPLLESPILEVPPFLFFMSQGAGPTLASVISSTRL
jgi:hypothetical protein